MRDAEPDVVIVDAGIAGGALGTVLARAGFEVALLERENSYPDRVRGEFMAPWGVTELAKLELLQPLGEGGALFTRRHISYDENFAPAEAEARARSDEDALRRAWCALPLTSGDLRYLRATGDGGRRHPSAWRRCISVTSESRPLVSCTYNGAKVDFQPQLVIGADGRNSSVRKNLSFRVNADEPRNLLGGMLVKGVPSWPRDMQGTGVEDRFNFLVFPQGVDLLRLFGSYHFADKSRFDCPTSRTKLIGAFSKLSCLPYAEAIAASTPIRPFNSFSNEDHWIDDPTCPA